MTRLALTIALTLIVCTVVVGAIIGHGASKAAHAVHASSNYEQVWNR